MCKLDPRQALITVPEEIPWTAPEGLDFDPGEAVPVYPGGFMRRVARTPRYDRALPGSGEPAVIAAPGTGPIRKARVAPSPQPLRRL